MDFPTNNNISQCSCDKNRFGGNKSSLKTNRSKSMQINFAFLKKFMFTFPRKFLFFVWNSIFQLQLVEIIVENKKFIVNINQFAYCFKHRFQFSIFFWHENAYHAVSNDRPFHATAYNSVQTPPQRPPLHYHRAADAHRLRAAEHRHVDLPHHNRARQATGNTRSWTTDFFSLSEYL